MLGLIACSSAAAVVILGLSRPVNAANSADPIVNNASNPGDLTQTGSYTASPSITKDVDFAATTYSPTTFTFASTGGTLAGTLAIGTLDDLNNTQMLSIQDITPGDTSTISLNTAANSLSGTAGDLLYVAPGANLTLGGGAGTLNYALNASGSLDVQGVLNLASSLSSGSQTQFSQLNLGTAAGASGQLNFSASGDFNVSSMSLGGNTTGSGAFIQTAGTVNITNTANDANSIGGSTSKGSVGYGYYQLSGGALNAGQMDIGARVGSGGYGVMYVTGGVATYSVKVVLARGNGSGDNGLLSVTGGTVNVPTVETGDQAGSVAVIDVGGGSGAAALNLANSTSGNLELANLGVASTTITNLLPNGTLSLYGITGSTAATAAALNFNGGALKANTTNAGSTFLPATGVNATIFSAGGTINNVGGNITIAGPLVPASGSGVTTITVPSGDGGSGYVGAPYINISGGTATSGNIATAVANMVPDGTGKGTFSIGSITITSPGTYSVVPTTLALQGGGPTTAASGITFATGTNLTTGGMTFTGSGTTTLSGSSTYAGPTTINSGSILKLTGSLGNTVVTVNSGGFLTGSGKVGGNINIANGGLIDFTKDGLSSTTTLTAGGMTLGAASSPAGITYNILGASSDSINLGSGVLNDLGGAAINLSGNISAGTNTYTLMTYGSQTGLTPASGGGFTIGTHPAGVYGFSFNDTSTSLQLTITATAAPLTAYWTGKDDTVWNDYNSAGPVTNFSSTPDGNTDAGNLPSPATDVVFTAASNGLGTSLSGATVSTTLGANYSINSLTVNSTAGSVGINGSNTLTLNAAASTGSLGYSAGTGIVVQSGAGPVNIGVTNLIPASSQSWADNGANPLTISSAVTGTATSGNTTTLTFNGSGSGSTVLSGVIGNGTAGGTLALNLAPTGTGLVVLGGNNTFTGGVTVNSGTLQLANAGALNSTTPNALNLSAGTLDLNSNSVAISSLIGGSGSGTGGTITDNNSSAGTSVLTDNWNGAAQTFYGTIANGAARSVALNVSGGGTVVLAGSNTYSGGTQLTSGALQALTSTALGSGTVNMSGGAVSLRIGNGVTLANRIIVGAAAPGAGNGALSTVTNTDTATFSGEVDFDANITSGGQIVGPTGGGLLSFTGPIIEPSNLTQPFVQLRAGIVQLADVTGNSSYPELLVSTTTASLGHNNGMATNAVLTMNSGLMDLNGYNQTVAGLGLFNSTATGVVTDTNGSAAGGDLGPGTGPQGSSVLTVNTSSNTYPASAPDTYGGNINSYIQLIKTGAGTLALTGSSNSYFGGTVIEQGVLAVSTLDNGNTGSPNGLGESFLGAQDLVFASPGGTLLYTGVTGSTSRSFTINDGVTATMDVSSATSTLTVNGNASVDGTEASNPASFAKGTGLGTLILTGTYPYHGNTTVNGGTLLVDGATGTPGFGSIIIASTGTLGGTGTVSGSFNHTAGTIVGGASATSPTSGSLTFTDPVILDGGTVLSNVNASLLVTGTVNQQGFINAAGGLTIGSTPEVINLQFAGNVGTGTFVYNLFDYSSLSGTPNFTYTTNLGRATFTTDLSVPGEINVDLSTSGPANLYWDSTSSGVWDVSIPSNGSTGTANWLNATTNLASKFAQGDNVTFADSGTVVGSSSLASPLQTNITINTTVEPGSIMVTSNTANYNFSGSGGIGGTGALTLSGNSTLYLGTTNTYTGGTNINAGTLNLASNGSIGTLGTVSFGGGILQYSANNNTDYSSRFSTANNQPIIIDTNGQTVTFASNLTSFGGSLTKLGAGALTLSGSNTYNGNTLLTGGTLIVSAQTNLGGNGPIVFNGGALGSLGIAQASPLTNPLIVNSSGGSLVNTGNMFFSGPLTGSGTLVTSTTVADVFTGTGFTPGNNSSSASFTGTIMSEYQVNLTDQSASPYANYNAAGVSSNTFVFGSAAYAPSGPVQLGSLSGVAGSSLRNGNSTGIGPVTYQIGNLGTNTTFAGNIFDTLGGAAANTVTITKVGTGDLTLSGSNTYSGGTNVLAGTLTIASATAYPAGTPLNVSQGAQVTVANHGSNGDYIPTISTLSNNGTIDIQNNGLIIESGTDSAVFSQVQAAYNNGKWNGTNANGVITSSLAASDSTHLTAVGVATNLTSFEGSTVAATDILVKYTYYGDANLDGVVDASDYSLIDNGYLNQLSGWQNGDFNYDGVINGSDYTLIDNAFNMQGSQIASQIALPTAQLAGSGATSAVPEPASLGLLGIGVMSLLGRRRHRRR